MYSRNGYAALKQQSAENTPILPDVFFGFVGLDVITQYVNSATSPIFMDRSMKINAVKGAIDAPQGTLTVQLEPKNLGYFLKGVFGAVTSGVLFPISSASGDFTVGETLTGGTSSETAVVLAVSSERDYALVGTISGAFTVGETLTGGSSAVTATLGDYDNTVIGHEFKAPQTTLPTFTLEVGMDDIAYRLIGVRFPAISNLSIQDNIMQADFAVFANAEFKHARVTAAVTSGSGAKTIPLDQTLGLIASDTIKVYRPSTQAFLDFSASSTKTHTIGSITDGASISVTNLQTSLAEGDLIVLAPRTPSYSTAKELSWIGASVARIADTMTAALSASAALASIESFEMNVTTEMEARHIAQAVGVAGRFPSKAHVKGFMGGGTLRRAYLDQGLLARLRDATKTSLSIVHTGDEIDTTGLNYKLDWRMPHCIFQPWNPSFGADQLLEEEMPFDFYRETSPAYTAKCLLVNDNTSY